MVVADVLGFEVAHRCFNQAELGRYFEKMAPSSCASIGDCNVACVTKFINDCTRRDPATRPTAEALLEYELLSPAAAVQVQWVTTLPKSFQKPVSAQMFSSILNLLMPETRKREKEREITKIIFFPISPM